MRHKLLPHQHDLFCNPEEPPMPALPQTNQIETIQLLGMLLLEVVRNEQPEAGNEQD
jgi:hypothetical protein